MNEKKLIPKLRFPEFDDEWEENFLNVFFDNKNERNLENLEVLSVTINNGVLKRSDLGSDRKNKDKKSMKHVLKGDLVYNPMFMWKGASGISPYEGITSADYIVLKSKENVNQEFFYHLFQTKKSLNKFKNYSQGSLLERLRLLYPQFSNIKMFAPSFKEQEKIASFLSKIDEKIDLLNQKLNQMKQFKKGLMQQIFAQKLRFDGFTDEWKKYKLGKIVDFLDNKRIPLNETERKEQKNIYPYYGASGIIDYVENYIFNEELILLGEDGTIGVNLATGKYWVNNHAHVLKAKNNINQYLLSEYLKTIRFEKYNTGTIQPKLNKETCKSIPIILPNTLIEQEKIAIFLSNIDNKIDLIQSQLNQTEEFKRGLLQSLFV